MLSCFFCPESFLNSHVYIYRTQFLLNRQSPIKQRRRTSIACVASVSVGLSAGLEHFSLFERAKLGASAKKVREGGGERRKGNACPQTPRFWKTRSSTNGVSWLARHGSVDCQMINPSIKSGMFIWVWPAWTQRTGSSLTRSGNSCMTFPHQFTITIFT